MARKQIDIYEGVLDTYSSMSSVFDGELEIDGDLIEEMLNSYKGKKIRLTIEVLEEK